MQTPSADAGAAGRRRPEDFKDLRDLRRHFAKVADGIRSGQINVIRSHYALSLTHGVMEANESCGVQLAIREFTEGQPLRKIVKTPFNIPAEHGSFQVLHVLDHPIRNGTERPRFPLHLHAM